MNSLKRNQRSKTRPSSRRNTPSPNGSTARSHDLVRIQHVLVGVDFSPGSTTLIRQAVSLAKQLKAALTILHVVPADYGMFDIGKEASRNFDKVRQSQATAQLRHLAQQEIPKTVQAELQIRLGRPAEEIIAAAETGTDLIIVATHGNTGLDHILVGSVAERVVRLARCPVLVARIAPAATPPKARPDILRFQHRTKTR